MPDILRFPQPFERVIRTLLDPASEISATIPDSIDHDRLWEWLSVACRIGAELESAALRMRPVIGRMLWVIQENPAFYTERGYPTFEKFITEGIEHSLGLSRTVAYQALRLYRKFPTLSGERFERIGVVKLNLLSRFIDETRPSCEEYLERAETLTTTELREYAEENREVGEGELTPAAIVIHTSLEIKKHWLEFISDPRVIQVCGTADPGQILERLLQESSGEFLQAEA